MENWKRKATKISQHNSGGWWRRITQQTINMPKWNI